MNVMAIRQNLCLRQSAALAMTPQLQQAIKLLQMSVHELSAFVDEEVERNPFLERAEAAAPRPSASARPAPAGGRGPSTPPVGDRAGAAPALRGAGPGSETYGRCADPTPALATAPSLHEHLSRQIRIDLPQAQNQRIALALLEHLDDAGYLTVSTHEIAKRLGVGSVDVERVLGGVQRLDPPGVFARSLKECLAAQLADRGRLDRPMRAMLDNLPLLAQGALERLVRVCGVERARILAMAAEIRALDPKPGQRFQPVPVETVLPEVTVLAHRDGGWDVTLNADVLPRVLIDRSYHRVVAGALRTEEDRRFVDQQLRAASWLERALDQRARTVLTVASEIVRRQHDFLLEGPSRMHPLVLREVAEATGLHESTVSRATSNTYAETPRGVFELKHFFTAAIAAVGEGEARGAEAVRSRIRALIGAEDRAGSLSDGAIVDALRAEGIDVARRTVAKYREALKIPSSVARRRAARLSS